MEKVISKKPPSVIIGANNWFHLGWLHSVIGEEKWSFDSIDFLVTDQDCDAYEDGYRMATETGFEVTDVFKNMNELGQLTILSGHPYKR